MSRIAKAALALDRIERKYSRIRSNSAGKAQSPGMFARRALSELGVPVELPHGQLEAIRRIQGPVIFVANHPFGALDALVLMAIMSEVRPDFRFVGSALLEALPELGPALLPVRVMGAVRPSDNFSGMRKTVRHLLGGGVLGMFPAGQVSELTSWKSREASDLSWTPHLGRLARKSRATVVPVFFEGRNSRFFLYAGLAFPRLRIALLAREMLKYGKYRKPIRPKVGTALPFSVLESLGDDRAISARLRSLTYNLKTGP